MSQLDYDLEQHLESEDKSSECAECGIPIIESKEYCSKRCFRENRN